MNQIRLTGFIMAAVFMSALSAHAQGQTKKSLTTKSKIKISRVKPAEKDFTLSGSLGRSNSLVTQGNGQDQAGWDASMAASYKLSKTYTLSGLLEYSYDLKKTEKNGDFGRGQISLKKSGMEIWGGWTKLTTGLTVGLPVSEGARIASTKGSLGGSIKAEANPRFLIYKKMSLAGTFGMTRTFHQYETTPDGKFNSSLTLAQSFEMGWKFNEMFSTSMSISHIDTFDYNDTHKDYFAHSQELGIAATKKWSFALGHQYGAPYVSTLKANGQDLNFAIVDKANSLIYANMTFTY
jgi:hypothetical protein